MTVSSVARTQKEGKALRGLRSVGHDSAPTGGLTENQLLLCRFGSGAALLLKPSPMLSVASFTKSQGSPTIKSKAIRLHLPAALRRRCSSAARRNGRHLHARQLVEVLMSSSV